MQYLRSNYSDISRKEYESLKQSLDVLNSTINKYNDFKTILFNFRRFGDYIKETKDLSNNSKNIIVTNNKVINEFHNQLLNNIIFAFFSYTPFFRSEIILRIMAEATNILIKIGVTKCINFNRKIMTVIDEFNPVRKNMEYAP